ncbi:AAA family ATPase, partial [Thermodesulfobacteriota bacterium]
NHPEEAQAPGPFKLTEGFFRFEAFGERKVKGKEKPVKVFGVIAPSTIRTRFDVSAERGLTPFVGRDRALELLLDGFERSKAGRGQAFSIMAEAGVGKSRLLYEFRKAVTNEDITFLEGKCLSYSTRATYHPVIEIVKASFYILESDGDKGIREKLKQGLKILDVDEASTLPYLLELLSVKDSGVDTRSLSPEAIKDKTYQALIRITIKASQIRPLILAIEDLHWIDKSSEDYLKVLLDSIAGARVFLIFTYRPEFVHTWGAKSYHSQVTLNRLSNRESLMMVSHLLSGAEIHEDLEDFILEKTEGVPFFIEEFIKSLKDLKIIERKDNEYLFVKDFLEMTIPSTVQDVIMARVDMLSEGAKELLQIGSVVEREFNYELIKQLTDLPEQDLLSRLAVLKDAELLYERGIYPESSYIFKHALTREVVYDSILIRRRKSLHKDIGNAIEELYKDSISEYYEVLAEHYVTGENYEKGAQYSKFAGRKAEKAAALSDAIAYAEKVVASLERLPRTKDADMQLIDARTTIGLLFLQLGRFAEAKEAVAPIVDLASECDYKRRLSQIYAIVGCYYVYIEEDFLEGFKYLEEALEIALELNDILSLFTARLRIGEALGTICEFDKAVYHLEKALEINVSANVLWGIAAVNTHLVDVVYLYQGKVDFAYKRSEEILQIAEESGDIYSKTHAYWALGFSLFYKGFFKEAKEYLTMVKDLDERLNTGVFAGYANRVLGDTCVAMKEHEQSQIHYEKAFSHFHIFRHGPSWLNNLKILITMAKVMNNEKDINLNEILQWYAESKNKVLEGSMLNCIGSILLNIDDQHIPEAKDWIKRSIETNQKYGMRWNLAQGYALYADFFKRKCEPSKTKENLNKAIEIFEECGADGWAKKYEKELATLS